MFARPLRFAFCNLSKITSVINYLSRDRKRVLDYRSGFGVTDRVPAMETYLVQFYKAGLPQNAPGAPVFAGNDFSTAAQAYDKASREMGPGWLILWNQKTRMKLQSKQILRAAAMAK